MCCKGIGLSAKLFVVAAVCKAVGGSVNGRENALSFAGGRKLFNHKVAKYCADKQSQHWSFWALYSSRGKVGEHVSSGRVGCAIRWVVICRSDRGSMWNA